MERTPLPATEVSGPPGRPEKSKCHWQGWELTYLLGKIAEGEELETVGRALNRSAAACRRMLQRLLDGETPCPPGGKELLARAQAKLKPPTAKPAPRLRPLEAVRAEYRAIGQRLEKMFQVMCDIEKLLLYWLATEVAAGRLSMDEIVAYCPPPIARPVRVLADGISKFRQAGGGKGLADSPAAERNAAGELPLVVTGQGETAQKTYPEDLP